MIINEFGTGLAGPRLGGSERGDPPREPGARRHRQGDPDSRAPEPPTRAARYRFRRRCSRRSAHGRHRRSRPSSSQANRDLGRERAAGCGHLQDVQAVPVLPAPAQAAAGGPRCARRPGNAADADARQERHGARRAVRQPDPVCRRGAQGSDQPRQRVGAVAAGAAGVDAARPSAQQARHRRQADRQVAGSADDEPRQHRRDPAADGRPLQRRRVRQRVQQPGALRARRAAGLELHDATPSTPVLGCSANFGAVDRCGKRRAGHRRRSRRRAAPTCALAPASSTARRAHFRRPGYYRGPTGGRASTCGNDHGRVRADGRRRGEIISQAVPARKRVASRATSKVCSATWSGAASEGTPRLRHHQQPDPDRRADGACGDRRRDARLQRDQWPAVRPAL